MPLGQEVAKIPRGRFGKLTKTYFNHQYTLYVLEVPNDTNYGQNHNKSGKNPIM